MGNQRLHASQTFRQRAQFHILQEPACRLSAPHVERNHPAKSPLLLLGNFMLRVRLQPGINHPLHFGVPFQKFRDRHPVRIVPLHAPRQRLVVWLFPWSVYFPAIAKLSFKPDRESNSDSDRATRTRLLALCWAGVVLVFFTFSTTQ